MIILIYYRSTINTTFYIYYSNRKGVYNNYISLQSQFRKAYKNYKRNNYITKCTFLNNAKEIEKMHKEEKEKGRKRRRL